MSRYTKLKAIEFEKQAHTSLKRAEDSFERCDTDGFRSRWSNNLHYELYMARAEIAEEGGYIHFPHLFYLEHEVNAKLIYGQYGAVWLVDEKDRHLFNGREFIPFAGNCPYCEAGKQRDDDGYPTDKDCRHCNGTGRGNSRVQKQWGLVERYVLKPAHAVIAGKGTGFSGNAWVDIVEVDEVYDIYKDDGPNRVKPEISTVSTPTGQINYFSLNDTMILAPTSKTLYDLLCLGKYLDQIKGLASFKNYTIIPFQEK